MQGGQVHLQQYQELSLHAETVAQAAWQPMVYQFVPYMVLHSVDTVLRQGCADKHVDPSDISILRSDLLTQACYLCCMNLSHLPTVCRVVCSFESQAAAGRFQSG